MSISSAQAKAARASLNWSQKSLAEAAGVEVAIVAQFELGRSLASTGAIQGALEGAGITLIGGAAGPGRRGKAGDLVEEPGDLRGDAHQKRARIGAHLKQPLRLQGANNLQVDLLNRILVATCGAQQRSPIYRQCDDAA